MTEFSHTGVTSHALDRNQSLLLPNEIFPYYHLNDKSEYLRWPPEISAGWYFHLSTYGLSIASIAKRH